MNGKIWIAAMAVSSALASTASSASGALAYNGGTYSQNFDSLPIQTFAGAVVVGRGPHELNTALGVTGADGWQGANPGGSSTSTEFRAHNGSLSGSTGRGVLSLGTDGSTDRALGTLATSNQINTFGLVLQNNTGNTYTSADISFIGEQWRRGDVPAADTLSFHYGVSPSPADIASTLTAFTSLDFVAPNTSSVSTNVALNGNDSANQTSKSAMLTDLNWTPGSYLVLRWNGQDQSGQDDGLAIDNLNFTAQVPEPGMMSLAGIGAMLLVRRRRHLK